MTTPFQKNINEVSTGGVAHGVDPTDPTRANPTKASAAGALFTNDTSGTNGVVVTTNTTAVTGSFKCIHVLEDSIFTVFTETGATGNTMTGFTVPAGSLLFGVITAYTLSSGKVRAYNA